jgi:hypothetical protein
VGATRRNLQAQLKMLKKIVGTSNQTIRTKIFSKKVYLVPLKDRGAKNSYGGYATEFSGLTQNPKKKYWNTKYTIQKKNSQKNCVSYLKSVKEPKTRMGATRRNLQTRPKIIKKIIGTSNHPIRTNFFPKKSMFSSLKV